MSASFQNVTATPIANVYFGGKVVSHNIHFADGVKKTLGLIYPGSYHFSTAAAEHMEITAGSCEVLLDGEENASVISVGEFFNVAANSGFTITVDSEICQYVCSFHP